jgi:two-component system sensor histidine kinase PilS (NtrC family)
MNGVIENVLQMSRRKSAEPQSVTLRTWLDKFVEEFTAGSQDNPVLNIVMPEADLKVNVDPAHLSQVLNNLSQNGLRYSLKHTGDARIGLKAGMDVLNNQIYLEVVDYGVGVDKEQVQNLFEPFYTTESTGTGLGLYLCKELCEANRARLTYYRAQHGGSCFRISFA